jgi:hypothetical protein
MSVIPATREVEVGGLNYDSEELLLSVFPPVPLEARAEPNDAVMGVRGPVLQPSQQGGCTRHPLRLGGGRRGGPPGASTRLGAPGPQPSEGTGQMCPLQVGHTVCHHPRHSLSGYPSLPAATPRLDVTEGEWQRTGVRTTANPRRDGLGAGEDGSMGASQVLL